MQIFRKAKNAVSGTIACAMLFSTAAMLPVNTSAASLCTVDTSKTYQTIDGFGGMNHPEWTGKDLTDAQRQKVFGNGEDELGLSILRIFVNPNSSLWNLAVPTAKYATEHGVTVFASPWEPPSNLAESGGSNGKLHLPESNYAAYAKHLNDFGNYMKSQGVELYSVSVQNEPDYASEWTAWSTDETTKFLADYADQITSTRVMSPESFQYAPENASWVPDGGKKYYTKILNNAKAFANCDLFGTHFYGTQRDWMDFPALESCGKPIWMTEVYTDSDHDADLWPMALDVAENIHNGLVVGNMSAYVWWYIRRSYGPLKEDGTISKRGYCMAQFSKFVRPGDVRVEVTEQPEKNVYVSAFKNDKGQVTIVAVNKSDTGYAQQFSLGGEEITDVDRWRTSADENLALTENLETEADTFWAQLPAQSVSTFVITTDGDVVPVETTEPVQPTEAQPDADGYFFHDTFEEDLSDWAPHGSTELSKSGRSPYQGSEALLVQNRTKAWMGAEKILPSAFVPGKAYSFSVNVCELDGDATDTFFLKLNYTDASGEAHYVTIAEGTAPCGSYLQLSNESFTIPANAENPVIYVETADFTANFYIDEAIGAPEGAKLPGAGIPEIQTTVKGDVNRDGVIDVFDLALAKRGVLNGFAAASAQKAADVNENGSVDVTDLILLQKWLLGQIQEFPQTDVSAAQVSPEVYMKGIAAKMVNTEPQDAAAENASTAYGTFRRETIYSSVCGRNKNFNVLLPANYQTSKQYPVLYVLHGYWGDEEAMLDKGDASLRLRQIIGNAIASGEAEDMIVVFPDIYASDTQDKCDGMNEKNNKAYDNFINLLTKEIMPYMEQNYPIKTGRDNTAITGFSMGGRESLYIGFSRPDLFGYIGAMCPAPGLLDDQISPEQLKFGNVSPYLLFVSAGSNDTVVWSTPSDYHDQMDMNGVTHVWHYVNGGGHDGNSIRPHMYNFVRAVFKAS